MKFSQTGRALFALAALLALLPAGGAAIVYGGSMGSALKWFRDRRGMAAGIMAAEPGCPNDPALPCQIRSKIEAPLGESCNLDFRGRDLIIGSADGPAGSIRAGSR